MWWVMCIHLDLDQHSPRRISIFPTLNRAITLADDFNKSPEVMGRYFVIHESELPLFDNQES